MNPSFNFFEDGFHLLTPTKTINQSNAAKTKFLQLLQCTVLNPVVSVHENNTNTWKQGDGSTSDAASLSHARFLYETRCCGGRRYDR